MRTIHIVLLVFSFCDCDKIYNKSDAVVQEKETEIRHKDGCKNVGSTHSSAQCSTTQSGDAPTPPSVRPPHSGQTGGNYYPELIPPSKSCPSKPEDYEGSTSVPHKISTENTSNETTTSTQRSTTQSGEAHTRPPPVRPLVDTFKETSTKIEYSVSTQSSKFSLRPPPNRPPFAGQTGGNFHPQLIPLGKPWPSKPEGYEGFTSVPHNISLDDRFKEPTTTQKPSTLLTRPSNKPPFAGQTDGNFIPQIIKPSKPSFTKPDQNDIWIWPTHNPLLEDRFKETTVQSSTRPSKRPTSQHNSTLPENKPSSWRPKPTTKPTTQSVPIRPIPNRPPFAGLTGGIYNPQLIPSGKPWPARPEDYAGFSVTSKRP